MQPQTPSLSPATAPSPGSKINDYHAVPGGYYHFPRTKVTVHRKQLTSYLALLQDWDTCRLCPGLSPLLLETRNRRFIHVSGYLPCDLLFIGEAPGVSEDALGQPFVGPAGRLLHNRILDQPDTGSYYLFDKNPGIARADATATLAFTNVVSCHPWDRETSNREPSSSEIAACAPRLDRVVELAQPRGIVLVGNIARDATGRLFQSDIPAIAIVHPAWILRQAPSRQEDAIANCRLQIDSFLASL